MENALVGRITFNPTTRRGFIKTSGGAMVASAALSGLLVTDGCNATTWINVALSDLPSVIQVVTSIVGIVALAQGGAVSPALMQQINNWSGQAQKDLNDAKTFITEYQSGKDAAGNTIDKTTILGKIDAVLIDAQDNLSAFLQDFHITDTVTQSTVAASLGLAIATVLGIQAVIPPPPTPAPTTARLSLQKDNGANAIKEAFNVIVGKSFPKSILAIS